MPGRISGTREGGRLSGLGGRTNRRRGRSRRVAPRPTLVSSCRSLAKRVPELRELDLLVEETYRDALQSPRGAAFLQGGLAEFAGTGRALRSAPCDRYGSSAATASMPVYERHASSLFGGLV